MPLCYLTLQWAGFWRGLVPENAFNASALESLLEAGVLGLKVTACAKCNSRKGQKTLEEANMKLIKVPKAPKDYDILAIPLTSTVVKMLRMRKGTPEEWLQYLPKSSLEP
ncbi:hypothetical protein F0562_005638 [Nyssa sinensis]|uniref:Uncharacterized protein n=1 Tax=Nyssa sinensis TaxID=561372 RepID=A0A5J5AIN7_9ASTE|nr:hypothetical protein F0562_005638 [Nyssa sinensis]